MFINLMPIIMYQKFLSIENFGVMDVKINFWQAIVILLMALSVLAGLQALVSMVDPSALPKEFQTIWQDLVYIFGSGLGVVIFTFLRNILGFVENKLEANDATRDKIHYEANLLGATATKFALYIYGFTAAIQILFAGTVYQQYAVYIAGAIGIILDLILKAIGNLAGKK
jgi:hypothetical protein